MANVRTNNNGTVYSDAVTDTYTSTQGAKWTVGSYREENGKGYRFCKFNNGTGNVAAVAGQTAYSVAGADSGSATDPYEVTMDVSDTDMNLVKGVLLAVIPDLGFGWLQTKGNHPTVKTNGDDDIAKGDAIIGSTTDGVVNSTAQDTAPTNRVIGWAMAADVDADNTVSVDLTLD